MGSLVLKGRIRDFGTLSFILYCASLMALILFPGTLFSSGGHPAPPGHHPSQTKSQSLDPFADLSDLSSSLQGNEGPNLCAKRLIFTFYYSCVQGPWELLSASIPNAHWLKDEKWELLELMLLHDPHGHAVSAQADSRVIMCPGSRNNLGVDEALLSTGVSSACTW